MSAQKYDSIDEQPLLGDSSSCYESKSTQASMSYDEYGNKNKGMAVKTIFHIKVKKETTIWNIISLLVAPLVATSVGAYCNAMMPHLLRSQDFFAIEYEQVGQKCSDILFWAYLASMIAVPFMGSLYDFLGRWWFIIPSCFFLALSLAFMPLSSPHFWLLCISRMIMSILMSVINVNPLIIDYVKSESRGLVISFASLGLMLGELLMVTLFSLTRQMSMTMQFYVPAILISSISLTLCFLIREPKIKQKASLADIEERGNSRDHNHSVSMWSKFNRLTSVALRECMEQPKYPFCFICLLVTRLIGILFSVYLQLWIMSFNESGVIATKQETDAIYMRVVTVSLCSILLIAPVFGFISDNVDPRVIIPTTFIARCLVTASFCTIKNPNDLYSYILCVLLIVISVVQFISVEVLFMRRMKTEIRGTMNGLAHFFGSIGTTFFALVGGQLFDKIAPWAPFALVSVADGTVFIICLGFIYLGLIKSTD